MVYKDYNYLEVSRRSTKKLFVLTRLFFDPLAIPLTFLFVRYTRISPNQITFFAFLIGLLSSWFFYRGWVIEGAVGYYFFFLFDNIDGKIARVRNLSSNLGGFLDFVVDRIVMSSMSFGLILHFIETRNIEICVLLLIYTLFSLVKDIAKISLDNIVVRKKEINLLINNSRIITEFCDKYKIHFKPGQVLSSLLVYLVTPLSGYYFLGYSAAILILFFSFYSNIILPLFKLLMNKKVL